MKRLEKISRNLISYKMAMIWIKTILVFKVIVVIRFVISLPHDCIMSIYVVTLTLLKQLWSNSEAIKEQRFESCWECERRRLSYWFSPTTFPLCFICQLILYHLRSVSRWDSMLLRILFYYWDYQADKSENKVLLRFSEKLNQTLIFESNPEIEIQ